MMMPTWMARFTQLLPTWGETTICSSRASSSSSGGLRRRMAPRLDVRRAARVSIGHDGLLGRGSCANAVS